MKKDCLAEYKPNKNQLIQETSAVPIQNERRYDFDWLRVIVFGILIFYHTGLIFGSSLWMINNEKSNQWIVIATEFSSQWRLPLLFIISGLGVSFALKRRSGVMFLQERVKRLFIPLMFGCLFIIPIQFYYHNLFLGEIMPSFIQYQLGLFFISPLNLRLFHLAHLWFIAYLLVYSIIALPIFLYFRTIKGKNIILWLNNLFSRNQFIVLILIIPIIGLELKSEFILNGRLNSGSIFFIYFIYGYLFFSQENFSKILEERRKLFLISGVITAMLYLTLNPYFIDININYFVILSILKHSNSMLWIFAIIGYAKIFLNFQHSSLRYANEAVYPFYILHQTIIVILGYYIVNWNINIFTKFALISAGTFLITLIIHEYIIRKNNITRLFFGLKPLLKNNGI